MGRLGMFALILAPSHREIEPMSQDRDILLTTC